MKKKVSIFLVSVLTLLTLVAGINPKVAKSTGNDDFVIGTKNLNNTPENSAKVGDKLIEPEIGWKRYDDNYNAITYSSEWIRFPHEKAYNETTTRIPMTNITSASLEFKFTGTKFRIIGFSNQNDAYCTNFKVYIDNVLSGEYSQKYGPVTYMSLNFEKINLENKEHTVRIEKNGEGYAVIDAIDIDENGDLKALAESISLDKISMNLLEGISEKLTATVLPENTTNKKIIWTSSDTNIATVDENGNVTAVKEGQATIMAKVEGTELTDTCVVNVTKAQLPEETGNAILSISLVNGSTKQYDVSMEEINKFIQWYETRTKGEGTNIYAFSKNENPYKEIKEYIAQDKIASFEVKEYVSAN